MTKCVQTHVAPPPDGPPSHPVPLLYEEPAGVTEAPVTVWQQLVPWCVHVVSVSVEGLRRSVLCPVCPQCPVSTDCPFSRTVCVCVCVCVCVRESVRLYMSEFVCVCVCEKERGREQERESDRDRDNVM